MKLPSLIEKVYKLVEMWVLMAVRLGLIGLGYWGPNILRNFSELPDSDVVTVCDMDASKLKKVSGDKKYKGISTTQDANDLFSDKSLDAIVISTPTKTHYDLTKKGLESGKHIFVEKPLTYLPEQSLELTALAESQKRILMVGHIFLYNSVVRRMKEEINKGNLGDIRYLHATRTGLGPIRQDVGAIWDLAPHDISIFNYLLGTKPEYASADGRSYLQAKNEIEDLAFMSFGYPNDVMTGVNVSWLDPLKKRQLTVVGTKKMMVFDDVALNEKLVFYDRGADYQPRSDGFGEFQLSIRDGDIIIPKIKTNEPLKEECAHFLSCIKEGKQPLTDGRNGYEVVAALDATQTSLREGRKVPIIYK